jgi:hypothetical protein
MVIALIDDGDLDVGARQAVSYCQAAESCTDDDDVMLQGRAPYEFGASAVITA